MTREQRALALCGVAVVLTVLGGFVMTWFHIDGDAASTSIDLHGQTLCIDGACRRTGLSSTGFYGDNAAMTLWGSVAFALFACIQVGAKMLRGIASPKWTKKGYFWGVTMAGTVLTTAYLFPPDTAGKLAGAVVERTWAPLVLAIGQICAIVATYYAADASYDDDVGVYKPIVIVKPSKPTAP